MEINKVDYTDDNENIQANYYKLHDASSNVYITQINWKFYLIY